MEQKQGYCFLTEKEMMWAEALMEALKNSGIPSVYQTVLGAGVALEVGRSLERYQIFVPCEKIEEAREIDGALFGGEEEGGSSEEENAL